MRSKVALLVAGWIAASSASAVAAEDPTYDPKPAADDMVLPMPGELEMHFRRVDVPGGDFWYDPGREIRLGDLNAPDPFSHERSARVMGVFFDPKTKDWWYPIGKYEVSKAQFAAVLGDGDPERGLAKLAEYSGDKDDKLIAGLTGRAREQKLAEPVRWIGWLAVQEFIHRYNLWLYGDPGRTQALARPTCPGAASAKPHPGFVRLPSEAEWEYAARGGDEARRMGAEELQRPLPFDIADFERFAWLKENSAAKVRPIGRTDPTRGGLYDMFGNVAELVADPFRPEIGLGKVGGLTVRGGNVLTSKQRLRSGLREESPPYQEVIDVSSQVIEGRSPFVGFRLAVGTLVLPDPACIREIEQAFADYATNFRNKPERNPTAATPSPLIRSRDPILRLRQELENLKQRNPAQAPELDRSLQLLGEVEIYQDQELRQTVFDTIMAAHQTAAILAKTGCRIASNEQTALPLLEKLAKQSTQSQAQYQSLVRQIEELRSELDRLADSYAGQLDRLVGYSDSYIKEGLGRAQQQIWKTRYETAAFPLVEHHVDERLGGKGEHERWKRELAGAAPPVAGKACV